MPTTDAIDDEDTKPATGASAEPTKRSPVLFVVLLTPIVVFAAAMRATQGLERVALAALIVGYLGVLALVVRQQRRERMTRVRTARRIEDRAVALEHAEIAALANAQPAPIVLANADFDLRTLIEDVAEIAAVCAHPKGLAFVADLETGLPVALRGDAARLRDVLVQLATNAVAITEAGSVALKVRTVVSSGANVKLRISVTDTSAGMPSDRLDSAFASAGLVSHGARAPEGRAGLAMSRDIVTKMGGKIGVSSEPGKGSTFWIELTLMRQDAPASIAPTSLTGCKVLIVDDRWMSRQSLRQQLRAFGCGVHEASTGVDAIAQLAACPANDPFEVVLLDSMMTGMDGVETARAIRSNPVLCEVPVVLFTSLGVAAPTEASIDHGFAAVVAKPVRRATLFSTIGRATGRIESTLEQRQAASTMDPIATDLRALVVAESPADVAIARRLLEGVGLRADVASSGVEALRMLDCADYDVVLMNVEMRGMDGLATTAEVRRREERDGRFRSRIVAMTKRATSDERAECESAGMDDCVAKPLVAAELNRALGRASAARCRASGTRMTAAPALRIAQLEDATGGDVELERELLALMRKGVADQLLRARAAIAAGEPRGLRLAAHTIKGSALQFGADALASISGAMEQLADAGDLASAASRFASLEAEAHRVEMAIDARLMRAAS